MDDRPPRGQAHATLPLLERFPALARRVGHITLARLPTPVERLPLADADAFIKRDDLTGERYGGNKVRKLEFLLAEARARGASRLITVGALGSHHALATTVYGRALGFEVTVVLLPQSPTDHVREVLDAMAAHGAEVRTVRSPATVPAGVLAARIAHRRERVHVIAPGGSDQHGTLGYVNAALELGRQHDAGELPRPAEVHVAGGTLGTAVGLSLGFALLDWPTVVVAHRITSRAITNRTFARRLAADTLALLRAAAPTGRLPSPDQAIARFRIEHGQIGRGYGFGTDAGAAAADWFAANTALRLEATYTAKAAAGFLAAARGVAGPLLYWHTLSSSGPAPPPTPAV